MERQEQKAPGSAKEFWPKAAAKLLRFLEPWILSIDSPPEVNIEVKAGTVDARAMRYNGKTCIAVTACGPGKTEAVITAADANDRLISRYGHAKKLENGKYLFKGNDICSDVLVEN